MKKKILSLLITLPIAGQAANLSLEDYKKQVLAKDPASQAAVLSEKGTQLLLQEGDALTAIQFTSQLNYLRDKRATQNPAFQGTRTDNTGLSLGFKQQTNYGFQWALTQNYSHTKIFDAASTAVPVPDYYDSYPKLELTLSLWRNFAGAEIGSQSAQIEKQALARQQQAEINRIQKENEIENAYFSVLAQQEYVLIDKDSIERAEKVLNWTKSRIARNLADNSEIYQAQAAVSARKVELISAQTKLADSVRRFNSLRGVDSDQLQDQLVTPEINLAQLKLDRASNKVRKDLKLQGAVNKSNEASYQAQREKYKPQLDLSLVAAAQGHDPDFSEAQSKTFKDNKDYVLAALTLTVPINQSKQSDYREGYASLVKSQQALEEARLIDEKLSWSSISDQAAQLTEQIQIVRELEGLQKNKANAEREKFNRGRSTTFQVLSYEQDYLTTRSQRIALEQQIRQFINQLSLFE